MEALLVPTIFTYPLLTVKGNKSFLTVDSTLPLILIITGLSSVPPLIIVLSVIVAGQVYSPPEVIL